MGIPGVVPANFLAFIPAAVRDAVTAALPAHTCSKDKDAPNIGSCRACRIETFRNFDDEARERTLAVLDGSKKDHRARRNRIGNVAWVDKALGKAPKDVLAHEELVKTAVQQHCAQDVFEPKMPETLKKVPENLKKVPAKLKKIKEGISKPNLKDCLRDV